MTDMVERLTLVREELRTTMLAQSISGDRDTYSDGFFQGICYSIGKLDRLLSNQPLPTDKEV
jgi:hypothetical protein